MPSFKGQPLGTVTHEQGTFHPPDIQKKMIKLSRWQHVVSYISSRKQLNQIRISVSRKIFLTEMIYHSLAYLLTPHHLDCMHYTVFTKVEIGLGLRWLKRH